MDKFEFLSRLVATLAWPTVILFVAVIFALPLRRLIDSLSTVEVGAGKLKIRREFKAAIRSTNEAIASLKQSKATSTDTPALDDVLTPNESALVTNPWLEHVEQSPLLAVLRSWEALRTAIFELADMTISLSSIPTASLQIGLSDVLKRLQTEYVVNTDFVEAVDELRGIRDEVALGQTAPNQSEALAFVSSSWELTRACKAIAKLRSR